MHMLLNLSVNKTSPSFTKDLSVQWRKLVKWQMYKETCTKTRHFNCFFKITVSTVGLISSSYFLWPSEIFLRTFYGCKITLGDTGSLCKLQTSRPTDSLAGFAGSAPVMPPVSAEAEHLCLAASQRYQWCNAHSETNTDMILHHRY